MIHNNKDDLGRTIITGLITDFLDWHLSICGKVRSGAVGECIDKVKIQCEELIAELEKLKSRQ